MEICSDLDVGEEATGNIESFYLWISVFRSTVMLDVKYLTICIYRQRQVCPGTSGLCSTDPCWITVEVWSGFVANHSMKKVNLFATWRSVDVYRRMNRKRLRINKHISMSTNILFSLALCKLLCHCLLSWFGKRFTWCQSEQRRPRK